MTTPDAMPDPIPDPQAVPPANLAADPQAAPNPDATASAGPSAPRERSRSAAGEGDPAPSALDELGALDVDGVAAATWGTVIWTVALVGTLLMRDRLAASDAQWWIAVCAVAAVGGLVGRWYAVRRREAYRRRAAAGVATATPAPGAAA